MKPILYLNLSKTPDSLFIITGPLEKYSFEWKWEAKGREGKWERKGK